MHEAGNRLISVTGVGEGTLDGVTIIREIEAIEIVEENDHRVSKIDPLAEDVQQALAIIRWEESRTSGSTTMSWTPFVDAIQNRTYKDQ